MNADKDIDPMEIARRAAFPFEVPLDNGGRIYTHGLTKRELFAAMAMQGAISAMGPGAKWGNENLGQQAVAMADALLRELAK